MNLLVAMPMCWCICCKVHFASMIFADTVESMKNVKHFWPWKCNVPWRDWTCYYSNLLFVALFSPSQCSSSQAHSSQRSDKRASARVVVSVHPRQQSTTPLAESSLGRTGSGSSVSSFGGGGNSGVCMGRPLNQQGMPMSKYCYECGTKFPVPQAKYCCECGTKRIWKSSPEFVSLGKIWKKKTLVHGFLHGMASL